MKTKHNNEYRIRVWDSPTRVFHWLFAISFTVAMLTQGNSRYLDVHVFAGYAFTGLLAFRLVWGFIGASPSRFRSFLYRPAQILSYLRSLGDHRPQHYLGHNPAGSWAIFFILAVSLLISSSGLLVYGGLEQYGPFAGLLSVETGASLLPVHEVLAWALLFIIPIHIAGVFAESVLHHENLLASMVSGYKYSKDAIQSVSSRVWLGSAMVFTVSVGAALFFNGYYFATPDKPYLPYTKVTLTQNAEWQSECGDCHVAYHPSLLPQRSWVELFRTQEAHFGDDLALDDEVIKELLSFALTNAAENSKNEASFFIRTSVTSEQTLLRISDSPYWKKKHHGIGENVWRMQKVGSKSHCEACHLDAEKGTFEDGAMRIPEKEERTERVAAIL